MVFVSICEHASSVFTFVSISSNKIFLVINKNFVNFLLGRMSSLLKENVLRQVTKPSSLQSVMPVRCQSTM